jgi:hypothetical protein
LQGWRRAYRDPEVRRKIGTMGIAASHAVDPVLAWTIVGALGTILGTVVIVWVTIRGASPRRTLFYGLPSVTPLLARESGLVTGIEVRYDDTTLAHPQVVTVSLGNANRRDISRDRFDGGKPIRLDVGAQIVSFLNMKTRPSDCPAPPVTCEGSALLVGPCLIGKRQFTEFSLLIDGARPRLAKPQQSLLDVELLPVPTLAAAPVWTRIFLGLGIAFVGTFLAADLTHDAGWAIVSQSVAVLALTSVFLSSRAVDWYRRRFT